MFLRYEFFLLSSKGIFKFPKFTLRYSRSFFHLSILWWVLHRFPWKGCLQPLFALESKEIRVMNARSLVCFHENTWVTSHCFLVERFASFLTLLHHCQQRQFMLMSTYATHRDVWMDVQKWNLSIRLWSAMCHAYPENHFWFSDSTLLWGMVSWKWLTQSWNGESPSHLNVKKWSANRYPTSLKGAFLDKWPDSLASFG